ncbi:ATP-binding protein [Niameybacter massiliensis]|uniref:ATP-binding protein n=1 Tax=Holtiella tumoricola TaxID=3018743 RepID=A0AA42DMF7_9FIRM|nr:ATP-binding protein [Holtiella tumoricola]MDA3731456.1 ATP-binding protein [Holtiella tumoricola]
MSNKSIVDISPTKKFFVDSITRDISIEKCIMDLIDNSIGGAKRHRKVDSYRGYYIKIFFSKYDYMIEDNCGGISLEEAERYVFRFGNNDDHLESYSSGGFGIGMKRAFFKIGKHIHIQSATEDSRFKVKLDVDKWLKQEDWTIEVESLRRVRNGIGTTISIKQLDKGIAKRFNDKEFLTKLCKMVEKQYRKEINSGLEIWINTIKINNTTVSQKEIYRKEYTYKNIDVEVTVKRGEACLEESGWQIALNENIVVLADKSELTGWGMLNKVGKTNVWDDHLFQEFRGYVNAKAENLLMLPVTTTKDDIDTSSEVYGFILNKMIEALHESSESFTKTKEVYIQYRKPVEEVERLKKHLNVESAKEVGIKTYDTYLENNHIK